MRTYIDILGHLTQSQRFYILIHIILQNQNTGQSPAFQIPCCAPKTERTLDGPPLTVDFRDGRQNRIQLGLARVPICDALSQTSLMFLQRRVRPPYIRSRYLRTAPVLVATGVTAIISSNHQLSLHPLGYLCLQMPFIKHG